MDSHHDDEAVCRTHGTCDNRETQTKAGFMVAAAGEPSVNSLSSGGIDGEVVKGKKGSWLDTLHMNPRIYWPKKYRYTIEPMPGSVPVLSVRERDHYESNGYIIVRNLVPKERQQQVSKLLTSAESVDQALGLFANSPPILRYVECFCGPNVMAMHKGWINHTPAQEIAGTSVRSSQLSSGLSSIPASDDIPLHQDLFSLPFRPADRIVCALSALVPQSEPHSSLSLLLAPGSHRSSQMLTIDDDATIIYEPVPRQDGPRKELILNAGDTLFYHPLLSHAVPASAAALVSCHFASSECEYVIMSGHEALVPSHLQQISRIAVHPENEWKEKALLVRGKRITL